MDNTEDVKKEMMEKFDKIDQLPLPGEMYIIWGLIMCFLSIFCFGIFLLVGIPCIIIGCVMNTNEENRRANERIMAGLHAYTPTRLHAYTPTRLPANKIREFGGEKFTTQPTSSASKIIAICCILLPIPVLWLLFIMIQ